MAQVEFDWEVGRAVLEGHRNEFYDGPDDPLRAIGDRFQEQLDAEIEAAGGIEAWRAQKRAEQPA